MPADASTQRPSPSANPAGSNCNTPSSIHVQRTPFVHTPSRASSAGRWPASVNARKSSSIAGTDGLALEVIQRTQTKNLRQFIECRARLDQQFRIGEIGRRETVAIVRLDPS